MGLIRAAIGAVSGNLADQWKEYFYCDALSSEVIMARGHKKTSSRSSNNGNDNVISNGSVIAVADGQCMIIVDQGKVVDICAEPGQYTYDTSSEASIFTGELKQSVKDSLQNMLTRFSFGGDYGKDQRVYYFNTKELIDNKFGTPNPVPFKIIDTNIGLDMDLSVRCAGVYSYKITDPILFYTNVCSNVKDEYRRSEIESQLKAEFISALNESFGKLSSLGLRPSDLPSHTGEMAQYQNEVLSPKWRDLRGLEVVSVAISTITLPEEDQERLKTLQTAKVLSNSQMAGGALAAAQAEAMKSAAKNENGAAMGFMGMGMAMNAGGMNAQSLFGMGQTPNQQAQAQAQAGQWTCTCGAVNSGNFCSNCGTKKPEQQSGGFCPNCGNPVQAGAKFCPNCGNPVR